jgi:hypothetical protein
MTRGRRMGRRRGEIFGGEKGRRGEQEKVEGRGSQMIWGSWDMQRAGMPTGGTVPTSKVPKYLTSSKFLAPISIIFYLERVNFRNGNSLLPAS